MGYVYLLKADIRSHRSRQTICKIGMTDRPPHQRFAEIQQEWWSKRRIKIFPVMAIAVRDPNAVEAHFHRIFKSQSLYGKDMAKMLGGGWCSGDSEWFDGAIEKPALREFNRYSSAASIKSRKVELPQRTGSPRQRRSRPSRSSWLVETLIVAAIALAVIFLLVL
jgi:T5orf172 domain